ncbi:leucine-rich repeat-containing protein 34 [Megalops cyprinoides]|uniref:leucine-rich repeat-containing protein 34 n=1 Tax=Megalops cyprinoides TaxID=118141 RepID=UPI001864B83C|nr:leucine-rich repeat-containing protein 34 [Megalops cyprinoides]
MGTMKERYSAVCSELQLPINPYVLQVLEEADGQTGEVVLRLTGDSRLPPVQKLTDDDVLALSGTLRNDASVKALDLRYNNITDDGAKHLAALLQENVSLRSLSLMANDIKADGAIAIAKCLHLNTTLKTLRMTGNKLGFRGTMHLATMLQMNSTLEELDVSDCDLVTQSVIGYAIVLSSNNCIRAIDLSRPLLFSHQEETAVHFAQMLKVNEGLQELHLGKHGMTDSGVERLCEALRANVTLRYLDLRCNRIARDGARRLAELLRQNSAIQILDLSCNRIEDEGAAHLAEAISLHNGSLRALSIPSNSIGALGLVSLAKAMEVSSSLSHIYIWGNKLEEPACVAFASLIKSGRLREEHTDVSPYEVDGGVHLAVSHGLRRHYYWTPSRGQQCDMACNSSLALIGTPESDTPLLY